MFLDGIYCKRKKPVLITKSLVIRYIPSKNIKIGDFMDIKKLETIIFLAKKGIDSICPDYPEYKEKKEELLKIIEDFLESFQWTIYWKQIGDRMEALRKMREIQKCKTEKLKQKVL